VTSLSTADREVELDSGERIGYDALLLSTGARARRLRLPGSELEGIHYLRSLADAERLRKVLRDGGRIVVVGAGWIGCEIAATAREMGADVAMVGNTSQPLERVLGAELGAFFRDVHAAHGVELHLGVGVEGFRGGGPAEWCSSADGTVLAADAVVAGVGAPRGSSWPTPPGSRSTNEWSPSSTSPPARGVFAAGDVANAWHPRLGRRLRLEHWSYRAQTRAPPRPATARGVT